MSPNLARLPARNSCPALLLLSTLILAYTNPAAAAAVQDRQDSSVYRYKATRDLVATVNHAAALFAEQGEAAFEAVACPGSQWLHGGRFIFVFDTDGTCLFNPRLPTHVGKNLIDATDILGKPMHRWSVEIAQREE